jgi:hypothetical protein
MVNTGGPLMITVLESIPFVSLNDGEWVDQIYEFTLLQNTSLTTGLT